MFVNVVNGGSKLDLDKGDIELEVDLVRGNLKSLNLCQLSPKTHKSISYPL